MQKYEVSMTAEEFQMLKKSFEGNNPQLASNLQAMREKIVEFDRDVAQLLRDRPEGFEPAIAILLQGRNFLARYIGEAEVPFPGIEEKVLESEPDPIREKHVALFVRSVDYFLKTVRHVLNTLDLDKQAYREYIGTNDLLNAILSGQVGGIISLNMRREESIESHLRHDLKNMPDFDYRSAQKYALPPCVDIYPPHPLGVILKTIHEFREGTYQPPEQESFSLDQFLPYLVPHLYVPQRKVTVKVVDDEEWAMEGMVGILKVWPNLRVIPEVYWGGGVFVFDDDDIVLLDEAMGKITGTQVAKELQKDPEFRGLIASTTSGEKPAYTRWHFQAKGRITKNKQAAQEFVRFMNSLLRQVV